MSDKKLYVQAGKSVTSKRGLLGEGSEVEEKDFTGGEDSIKGLLKKEVIGEKKPDFRTKAEVVKEREENKKAKNAKVVTEKEPSEDKTLGIHKK